MLLRTQHSSVLSLPLPLSQSAYKVACQAAITANFKSVQKFGFKSSTCKRCNNDNSKNINDDTTGLINSSKHQKSKDNVRLRFAPSPTGSLHLGGLRTALFNHLLARNLGGKWILRIEDTDRTRYVPGALEELLKCLKWAGLDYDEGPDKGGDYGPYIQSERQHIYRPYIQALIDSGHAYHCFCPSERLDALRLEARRTKSATHYDGHCRHLTQAEIKQKIDSGERYVVRFRNQDLPKDSQDLVYGHLNFPKLPQEDFILIKGDGMPTYHFANVIDDHHMKISHVLRGEEWIPSIPKHLALYSAFNWQPPAFAHMPILVNPDGSKLSKRSGDVKVSDYIEKGYEPEALLNFVALMGSSWSKGASNDTVTDVMTMEDMISSFSLSNLNKHRSTMFGGKLSYLNKEHLKKKLGDTSKVSEVIHRARNAVSSSSNIQASRLSDAFLKDALTIASDRVDLVTELPITYPYFFKRPDLNSKEADDMRRKLDDKTTIDIFRRTEQALQPMPEPLEIEAVKAELAALATETGVKGAKLMTPLRYALTGQKSGPSIASLIVLLGKSESIERLTHAVDSKTWEANDAL